MLKQDEERFIDEALLPYLKQIAVQFTKDLRNSISIRFNIMPNADIELKRIATGKTSLTPKPSHSSEPRRAASNLRISLPQGIRIEQKIIPIRLKKYCDKWKENETWFIFPFNNPNKTPDIAYSEISKQLSELHNPTLFLNNLQTISYQYEEDNKTIRSS